MRKLKKINLNFQNAIDYFKDNLNETNTLCNELIKLANFENGSFFTLLPMKSNFANIYEFKTGGMLLQKKKPTEINLSYTIIPTIREELSVAILREQNKSKFDCIFDDVVHRPSDKNNKLFFTDGLFYENEVYYLIKNKLGSPDFIKQCLRESNGFWHSLCILTHTDLQNAGNKMITFDDIKEICLNTAVIIVGAYDSEGYVFWEKENLHSFEE